MKDTREYPHDRWERLLEASIASIRRLADGKGAEYMQGSDDRLANFRSAAEEQGLPMETIWRVYAGKHWDAIGTYCKDMLAEVSRPRSESISGRLDDLIVYALLMKAMVEEREEPLARADPLLRIIAVVAPKGQGPCIHDWQQMDRHTDICVNLGCSAMRKHVRRGR